MDRFGIRRVVAGALLRHRRSARGLTVCMTRAWQLVLCWGVLVGLGSGSMALAFAATVTNRWFVERRGLVTGILTAGGRRRPAGLPAAAVLDRRAPRLASGAADRRARRARRRALRAGCCCATTRRTWACAVRRRRSSPRKPAPVPGAARRALTALCSSGPHRPLLAARGHLRDLRRLDERPGQDPLRARRPRPRHAGHGGRARCSRSSASSTSSGTVASGWFTDRLTPRRLLAVYYALRGRLAAVPAHAAGADASTRRWCSSSSSTAWTGSPPCRRPSPCAASTTARTARSSSAGCSPPTRSARRWSPSSAAWRGTRSARTTWSGTRRARCARWPR